MVAGIAQKSCTALFSLRPLRKNDIHAYIYTYIYIYIYMHIYIHVYIYIYIYIIGNIESIKGNCDIQM